MLSRTTRRHRGRGVPIDNLDTLRVVVSRTRRDALRLSRGERRGISRPAAAAGDAGERG